MGWSWAVIVTTCTVCINTSCHDESVKVSKQMFVQTLQNRDTSSSLHFYTPKYHTISHRRTITGTCSNGPSWEHMCTFWTPIKGYFLICTTSSSTKCDLLICRRVAGYLLTVYQYFELYHIMYHIWVIQEACKVFDPIDINSWSLFR